MSEQNKIDEIKEDLNPIADEVWELDVFDVITNQDGKTIAEIFDRDAAPLLRKSIEYITYLLQEIERKDKALRFYADEETYEEKWVESAESWADPEIEGDRGEIAREAL